MKNVNAIVTRAEVHFFPDILASQIELTLESEKGKFLFCARIDDDVMCKIVTIFNKDIIGELQGEYCRLFYDEDTGMPSSIRNIVYDSFGELQSNPV